MKRIPCLHNTTPYEVILTIESRMDKNGNIYYYVIDGIDKNEYVRFKSLNSLLDFVQSNFK